MTIVSNLIALILCKKISNEHLGYRLEGVGGLGLADFLFMKNLWFAEIGLTLLKCIECTYVHLTKHKQSYNERIPANVNLVKKGFYKLKLI